MLSEVIKIRLVGMFLGLNDEQGCKMRSKYKEMSLISFPVNGKDKHVTGRKRNAMHFLQIFQNIKLSSVI